MELLHFLLDFVLNVDEHLAILVRDYGTWIYLILFAIIFCETGLVVTPFLPGDSLLFVIGALAATGAMDITTATVVLLAAAIIGDNVNYAIGRQIGPRVFRWESSRFFNKEAFARTHAFFEKHGPKALVMARFMPIIRTFAPFTAGVAAMTYLRFLAFSVAGGLLWVISLTQLGYWLGNIEIVKTHFEAVILLIIVLSLMPPVIAAIKHRRASRVHRAGAGE